MDISSMRRDYSQRPFSRNSLKDNPFEQFTVWFEETKKANIIEPNGMALATADEEGIPSCRTVLLKRFSHEGFDFFTNLTSRKAHEMIQNPHASATFWWKEMERQVHIQGAVIQLPDSDAEQYFQRRPHSSQVSAWASHQDAVVPSREFLENEYLKYEKLYEGKVVPAPPYWCGFRILPVRFEFWQGRQNRLHDRFQYLLVSEGVWEIQRLSP